MSERFGIGSSLTRREVVKGAAALATLGVLGGGAASAAASPARRARVAGPTSARHRVAIIGAGAGGVAAAYFLAGTHRVDLFEARSKIGGHCDSHTIEYRGRRLTVDIGAQFFHPGTHPIYVTLLEELGLFDPTHADAGDTLEAPASLCIFPTSGGPPVFSSTHPFSTPQLAGQFAHYAELARQAVLSGLPWETTVEDWIGGLAVSQSFKATVAYPWTTALIGSPRTDALRASARSILQTFALSFPVNIAQGATTYNSRIGLQGNLQRLLDRTPTARVALGTPVTGLTRTRTGWFVATRSGLHGPYSFVVLNAPPHNGRHLLPAQPRFADVTDLLKAYEYFNSRLLIHLDPTYVQHDRTNWSVYNAGVDGRQCEGSVWYGALRDRLPSGQTVDLFKSWAKRRDVEPTRILLERQFKHPVISRSAIQAARALRPLQGRHGLYFSGVYTTGFDSQESAIYSAMKVAESLAPDSRALASLKKRLAERGLAGISYDL
jgi:predicted NAD/FAD-binding protein